MQSRREFSQSMLGALTAFGLIETLWSRDLFAAPVKPIIEKWVKDLVEMTGDLKGARITDVAFQSQMEALFQRVDLSELCSLVDFDEVEKRPLPTNGAAVIGVDLRKVDGLPEKLAFGKQIFACAKDRSIVPHGHRNLCTGFIILKGKWHGRHYDKLETRDDHYIITPTIDREFDPGSLSTVSDHRDNVHWFKAVSETAYIFNVHIYADWTVSSSTSGRLYLDPDGEKLPGDLIRAPKMSLEECHAKYG